MEIGEDARGSRWEQGRSERRPGVTKGSWEELSRRPEGWGSWDEPHCH